MDCSTSALRWNFLHNYSTESTHWLSMLLTPLTWDLGGELCNDWWAVAFSCASTKGEGVRGAWVKAGERVGGLIAQFYYLPTLVGKVKLRVKGAHRLVGDLGRKEMITGVNGWEII